MSDARDNSVRMSLPQMLVQRYKGITCSSSRSGGGMGIDIEFVVRTPKEFPVLDALLESLVLLYIM